MNRLLAGLLVLLSLPVQPAIAQAPALDSAEQEPPEEDEALQPRAEYVFNPLQAEKELKIGAFYFKRGSFPAAAMRFEEATKWNPAFAEAWRRLGEAREKLKDSSAAIAAYSKFVELTPDAKQSAAAKKRIATLNAQPRSGPASKAGAPVSN